MTATGSIICMLGVLLNILAVYFNGGKMPAITLKEELSGHKPITEDTRLRWLCDIWKVRHRNKVGAFSTGDVLIIGGVLTMWYGVALRLIWPN